MKLKTKSLRKKSVHYRQKDNLNFKGHNLKVNYFLTFKYIFTFHKQFFNLWYFVNLA